MTFKERVKGAVLGLLIAIVAFPIAILATLLTIPFWSWIEQQFAIEAIGHSGPAEWCYLVAYFIVIILFTLVWSRLRRNKASNLGTDESND